MIACPDGKSCTYLAIARRALTPTLAQQVRLKACIDDTQGTGTSRPSKTVILFVYEDHRNLSANGKPARRCAFRCAQSDRQLSTLLLASGASLTDELTSPHAMSQTNDPELLGSSRSYMRCERRTGNAARGTTIATHACFFLLFSGTTTCLRLKGPICEIKLSQPGLGMHVHRVTAAAAT